MSLQFGKWSFDGRALSASEFTQARESFKCFSPDEEGFLLRSNVGVLCRAFHTDLYSRREKQPFVAASGLIVAWDGRLDNREALMRELDGHLPRSASDVEIVTVAYERWNTSCFPKLMGDWAMALYDPTNQTLTLARDFLGIRHLYYSISSGHISWSTILDPLVIGADISSELDEEYIAGWLAFFPDARLTPFRKMSAVPPGSYVYVSKERRQVSKFWNFDTGKRIRYRIDSEYEEHFRSIFREAVRRRLRSDSPVLAELSGGTDSSSIVCVADDVVAQEGGPRLDTVSYYDNSEPSWNELPFLTKIEEKRGTPGWHIDIQEKEYQPPFTDTIYPMTPAFAGRESTAYLQLQSHLTAAGHRVLLSGIGGDEVLGGVPNPIPELADSLTSGHFADLARQLKAWALSTRKPWIHLLRDTLLFFSPPGFGDARSSGKYQTPCWVKHSFAERSSCAFEGYRTRATIFGSAPSLQENLFTLDGLRRQLCCLPLPASPSYEQRYPYLDRDLLEFLFAIPREQLVRPGQRRSLMRRALSGIVPDEVLNRKRKAFVTRAPALKISGEIERITRKRELALCALGVVDREQLLEEMRRSILGADVPIVPLLRAFTLEAWLTALIGRKVLSVAV